MKKIILLIIVTFILTGCGNQTLNNPTWHDIVNKEWSNFDIWCGTGLYFHEEDNIAYCTFMIYGSGVRVMYKCTSEVIIEEEYILIKLPENMSTGYLSEDGDADVLKDVKLYFEVDSIMFGEMEFKDLGISNYEITEGY